jgi:hypothetical protein
VVFAELAATSDDPPLAEREPFSSTGAPSHSQRASTMPSTRRLRGPRPRRPGFPDPSCSEMVHLSVMWSGRAVAKAVTIVQHPRKEAREIPY